MVLHQIKRAAGRGGSVNVWIDARNVDVIAPETLEVIGNLFDFP